jgi:hypothetical protein
MTKALLRKKKEKSVKIIKVSKINYKFHCGVILGRFSAGEIDI